LIELSRFDFAIFCQSDEVDYLSAEMDWQQGIALSIVGATAAAFIWQKTRVKKFSFKSQTHCGCSSREIGPKQTIQFHARKGERPQIIVRPPLPRRTANP
jgi:hypothetical protein